MVLQYASLPYYFSSKPMYYVLSVCLLTLLAVKAESATQADFFIFVVLNDVFFSRPTSPAIMRLTPVAVIPAYVRIGIT